MKTSKYNIYVDLPDSNNYLLVHGYTGAIDSVGSSIYHYLKNESFSLLTDNELEHLLRRGYITNKTENEEYERVAAIAKILANKENEKKNFTFIITYDCNFRCSYCYESKISENGNAWTKETFNNELIDAAYCMIDNSFGIHKNNTMMLCGGEPLLKINYAIVTNIVKKGIERGFKISAITNGYEIDAFKDLLGKDAISYLQITVDGSEQAHNKRRRHFSGVDTYNKIMENISMAISKQVFVSLRVNVDKDNINDLESLIVIFERNSWIQNNYIKCYLAPVRSCDNLHLGSDKKTNICAKDDNLLSVLDVYGMIKEKQKVNKKYSIFNPPGPVMTALLKDSLLAIKRPLFKGNHCGATSANIIFDPRGGIYSCLDFVGVNEEKIGCFFPEVEFEIKINQELTNRKIYNMENCSRCKYALFCGGGCLALSRNSFGNYMKSNCDQFPIIFKKSISEAFLENRR